MARWSVETSGENKGGPLSQLALGSGALEVSGEDLFGNEEHGRESDLRINPVLDDRFGSKQLLGKRISVSIPDLHKVWERDRQVQRFFDSDSSSNAVGRTNAWVCKLPKAAVVHSKKVVGESARRVQPYLLWRWMKA